MADSLSSQALTLVSTESVGKSAGKPSSNGAKNGDRDAFSRVLDEQRGPTAGPGGKSSTSSRAPVADGKNLPSERSEAATESRLTPSQSEVTDDATGSQNRLLAVAEQSGDVAIASGADVAGGSPLPGSVSEQAALPDRAGAGEPLLGAGSDAASPSIESNVESNPGALTDAANSVLPDASVDATDGLPVPGLIDAPDVATTATDLMPASEDALRVGELRGRTGEPSVPLSGTEDGAARVGDASAVASVTVRRPGAAAAVPVPLSGPEVSVPDLPDTDSRAPAAAPDGPSALRNAGAAGRGAEVNELLLTRTRADWIRESTVSGSALLQTSVEVKPERLLDSIGPIASARGDSAPPSTLTPLAASLGVMPSISSSAAPAGQAPPGAVFSEYALAHAPDDPQFPAELTARMKTLLKDGVREARLQLHPAELGRLQVTVSTDGDQARVSFVADTAAARDAIEQSMPRLREMLEQNGMQLAQSDVAQRDFQGGGEGSADNALSSRSDDDIDGSAEIDGQERWVANAVTSRIDTYI